jgi:hypothetical protein
MRRTSRNSNSNSNINSNAQGEKTMKRTITRNSNQNNGNSNSNQSNINSNSAQILATLKSLGINADAFFGTATTATQASEETPKKADRAYELQSVGADFTKFAIYAAPKSESAGKYFNEQKMLCEDVLSNLSAPIASNIKAIAERAEKDGGASLKNDLLTLADTWKIPAQSMRVIMQLCAPVVCVCNPETDDIARRAYGMARANALMGSACNTLMYAKATDKSVALPFKRVAHNLSALGLDFAECASVSDCDFCEDDKDFEELVTLCDIWLKKCERITPKDPVRGKKASGKKASEAAPVVEDKNAQILALLQSLLNK